MQHFRFLLVLLLFSCGKSAPVTNVVALNIKQCTQSGNTTLCLNAVAEDSRCPHGSECIWSGQAVANFTFTAGEVPHTLDLTLGKDTTVAGYRLNFINLYPYPGDPPTDTRAEVEITR